MLGFRRFLTRTAARRRPAPPESVDDLRGQIEALMAQPVKPLPKIIVVGDDAVIGINPAPPQP